jgi:dTDP-4-amino-4,6-dideoxygalactose transaminase
VLDSGWFILGREVEAFEGEFAQRLGARHAVAIATGTDAIELSLRALDIGPGDEVVTQANTCVPTVAAIERSGATVVLCDATPGAATMDPASAEAAITQRTAAIVPVHLYGQCADLDAIETIAVRRGVALIEDCAQATGETFRGRAAGTVGVAGCFSFYPSKNLASFGDAGAVITDDDDVAVRLRRLRTYGIADGVAVEPGVNSRMDEIQAAVLRVKLASLDARNERRREIAQRYREALEGTAAEPLALLDQRLHAYHQFVVTVDERERFRRRMDERGVATMVHYPTPIHRHPAYGRLAGDLPLTVSERLCERVVSLPIYPELTDEEVETVAVAARESAGA